MRTTVITGAASGIGAAIAQRFAEAGDHVEILDLEADAAESAAAAIRESGHSAKGRACNVAEQETVNSVIGEILANRGSIDVLVNNAGIAHIGDAISTSGDDMDRLYQVNIKGVYHALHAVLPGMVEAGSGVILNMASIASVTGIADRFAYSMTKGAVLTMTYSVAIDFIDKGIRCNAICPARVHTPFVDGYLEKNYPDNKDEMFKKLSAAQPIGRMAQPEEIAEMALYLCSDKAGFITGQDWEIDGGFMNARPV
jgi:NAD(P)-dependent dehydrogenase (short-subunit alcohol dehydrogenase family)